jgi:hypothetical protein
VAEAGRTEEAFEGSGLLELAGSTYGDIEGNFLHARGWEVPKAGVNVVTWGLAAANLLKSLMINVKLGWIPEGCKIEDVMEAYYTSVESTKHTPPNEEPGAFIQDIQVVYKRKREANIRDRKYDEQ